MLDDKIKQLPSCAGVYIMKSAAGEIIYVGKANNLKKRVTSYFSRPQSTKNTKLLQNIADIEIVTCSNEAQALILESALIKEKQPKFNISLKDDKSYPYLEITKENFPRVSIVRCKKKNKNIFFGPYPKARLLKEALDMIRRVFPYRSCQVMPKTACLYFHLGLCSGPCIRNITQAAYKENIQGIGKILKGERHDLVKNFQEQMNSLAIQKRFEEAAIIRNKLFSLQNLYWGVTNEHELIGLKDILGLSVLPLTIEAVDISNLKGELATGSLVVFKDGLADKNSYRRFRIKTVERIDDYAMIQEVVRRRYLRLLKENKKLPDLLLIDGGQGHVQAAVEELKKHNISLNLIGLAKENEEVWLPGKNKPLVISKNNPALKLVQRIRDEAHRFARSYHLLLRNKNFVNCNR